MCKTFCRRLDKDLHSISGVIVVKFCSLYNGSLDLKEVALAFSGLPL